jgi:hypothetical protein
VQELFPTAVYTLCFATSSACAWLLSRGYARSRAPLLLWSALCFLFLALNNMAVILDLLILTDWNLGLPRLLLSLAAVGVLLFGFIWDLEAE